MSRVLILFGLVVATAIVVVNPDFDVAKLLGAREVVQPRPVANTPAKADMAARQEVALLVGPDALRDLGRTTVDAASGFDVVRIDPNGMSVLAGRATPNAEVVISANGKTVATVKADAGGDWSAVTQHKFDPGRYQLSMTEAGAAAAVRTAATAVDIDVKPGAPAMVKLPVPQTTVASAPQTPVRQLEGMIADVKAGSAPSTLKPVPIHFVYREATFTDEGRRAARLLAEYLMLQRPDSVTLSGHADERGSDQLNMELSRERLETVIRHLRQNGYAGKVVLLPKGKTEPYGAIDRRAMPREHVYQLDRRVELRVQ